MTVPPHGPTWEYIMTDVQAGASPATHPDPVANALGALVGAGERLVRLVGEYEQAAQVAALRGTGVPNPLVDQAAAAGVAWWEAVSDFARAAFGACPKAQVPDNELVRIRDLVVGDVIAISAIVVPATVWRVVTGIDRDAGPFDARWVVRTLTPDGAEAYRLVDWPDHNVRRQVAAQPEPDNPAAYVPAIGEFDGDAWSAPVTALPFGTPSEAEVDADERREARLDAEGGAA